VDRREGRLRREHDDGNRGVDARSWLVERSLL
jgi:hypothetical protein